MASAYKTSGGRCCGTKKSRTIWCLVSVLLLIGIGLTIYFLFPRLPIIYVNPPGDLSAINSVNYNTNSSNPLQGIINASEQNPFTLSINISVLVTVYSPNYIDIYANRINVEVNSPFIFFWKLITFENESIVANGRSKWTAYSSGSRKVRSPQPEL